MAKRQTKYYEKPHVMAPWIRRRFRELINEGKKEQSPSKPADPPKPKYLHFRWDTLEDADQGD
jgi:hypothetical protein